ncbi:MAG: acyl-CoA dehydratase activase, partial [Spirochaetes bacterium]|nr:acyl-CoA dehydratase activase [Spirochaetota bacterium]
MKEKEKILGIDIGSVSVSIAELDRNKEVIRTAYVFHEGKPAEALLNLLRDFDIENIRGVAATSSTPAILKNAKIYDSRISFITAAMHFNEKVGSILIVGGERFGVVLFDDSGRYRNYRSNTSCAAGTGSFLDQQASRLNLSGIREFSEIAYSNTGKLPKIASRCAVFAKTDLIHAQQEGYSLAGICDGLSFGLVKNITDTLFSGTKPAGPVIFCGGVSRNRAVIRHLSAILGAEIKTDEYSHVYGAVGAAVNLMLEGLEPAEQIESAGDIIEARKGEKKYHYGPLALKLSSYPDFDSFEKYEFKSAYYTFLAPVEVDIYQKFLENKIYDIYLGIDIGSTSTKAVIADKDRTVLAGFYTRTSGRPVQAMQIILEAIDNIISEKKISLNIIGAGTTGSGRKFIAEIINADIALDEITAHARAAYELDAGVDTVIEIGGQDSKFTTIRNGMVTFSIMNNVCAAGTGSFIEEQAKKLGCPISDYSARAENPRAPLSSDRCTVFMERDLNHYLTLGYSVDEILASVLHSVRENYLTKVAIESSIGSKIFFQGATAKNRALVAAFEQRLGKPIMVSKYCHLTGALGAALYLCDKNQRQSSFRGIGLYKSDIPVRTEVCELCTNHCKIKIADIGGETAAFGFLCGRDYNTEKYVKNELSFDLLRERKKILTHIPKKEETTIGIPAALHLYDELYLWKRFFSYLSIKTITSENYTEGIREGKNLSGAEFCAPIAALHGHIKYLFDKSDYIFLPNYIEEKNDDKEIKRNYCYYTQFSPALIASSSGIGIQERLLMPSIRTNLGLFYLKAELYRMLNGIPGCKAGFAKISDAYDRAYEDHRASIDKLKELFDKESKFSDDINVVFVGRPYTVLSRSMNNGIPEIFAKHGIKTFFQDMLTYNDNETADIRQLLKAVHWKYAAKICEAASVTAKREGLYPVFITSFKCTPDSYAVPFFKKILDQFKKPYLILQLDEHDSSVGYETRIEAAIRSFRNHLNSARQRKNINPLFKKSDFHLERNSLKDKTILMPNWDSITCKLLEGAIRAYGIDLRVLEESTDSIMRSMSLNNGQCIPLNIIIQNTIDYVKKYGLDPEKTAVWSPNSKIACNLGMFPFFTKDALESRGGGFEKIEVFSGAITFVDISIMTGIDCYLAYMFGGMLRKLGCSIRPYENRKGSTDRATEESIKIIYDMFLNGKPKEKAIKDVTGLFEAVSFTPRRRPKAAIFGDLYVRDNDIMNQNLIRVIEDNGGEVVTTPFSQYMNLVANRYIKKWFIQGHFFDAALSKILSNIMDILDYKYHKY